MKSVAASEAKDKLSSLVDEAEKKHEIIRITRHRRTAAVLMSEDDLESLRETLVSLSLSGIHEDVAEGRRAMQESSTTSASDVSRPWWSSSRSARFRPFSSV